MRELPILFSTDMVRAILDGRKTQTRRVVNPQPDWLPEVKNTECSYPFVWPQGSLGQQCGMPLLKWPYGKTGDRLWVRETFYDDFGVDRSEIELQLREGIYYRADGEAYDQFEDHADLKWRPSIFMPRWASRITLEITNVRVERLHQITQADIRKEGGPDNFVPAANLGTKDAEYLLDYGWFSNAWDKINGKKHPWKSNPWVWVVEFRKV